MRNYFGVLFIIFPMLFYAQDFSQKSAKPLQLTSEFMLGWMNKSNENFPEKKLKKQLSFSVGKYHEEKQQEWAQRLKGIKTGFSIGFSDFGNQENLGFGVSAMPFVEFPLFKNKKLKLHTSLGAAYHTRKYHPQRNSFNEAVSTSFTWAYKLYLYYKIIEIPQMDWKIGGGYAHHSNGHTRLRNQGLNSFLMGISATVKPLSQNKKEEETVRHFYPESVYSYFSLRGGLGWNVLSTAFNDRKNVYVFSAEYGKIINNTWKLGAGFYYNFYQHYYDYIKNNHSLVQSGREFDYFQKSPKRYASNLGVLFHGEVLLNHFGIDIGVGFDIYKPAYKLDWRINEGWRNTPVEIPEDWVLGEYTSYFKLKYRISARLGLKYYFFKTHTFQPFNIFMGAHINSNLGQADFSEFTFGCIYNFKNK